MALFLITPLGKNFDAIGESIKANFADGDYFALQNSAGWVVNDKGTSKEVSLKAGLTSDDETVKTISGSGLVTRLTTYYGRGPTDMWEWIRTRLEGAN